MTSDSIILITLILYQFLLLGIGIWASRRTQSEDDFFLGGRGLGPVVAAISYSSSASSAWTLLGVSGVAYVMGIGALWIVGGTVSGMLVAWYWIAPKLRQRSLDEGLVTLTDLLLGPMTGQPRRLLLGMSSAIIVVSFGFYVAAQFQGAGTTFANTFELSTPVSIGVGAGIILLYTLLGGFWAVSVTDTVQGLLMAATAVLMPVAAWIAVGGWSGFIDGLQATSSASQLSWTAGNSGLAAVGFIIGLLLIGIGTYGQPHLLVRFMALRDYRALKQARLMTIAWYLLVFLGMCILGLCGRILAPGLDDPETLFFVLSESLFSPVVGAILISAVLSAIMSTADSQLLVAASAISHDLGIGRKSRLGLLVPRLTIVLLVLLAVSIALLLPEKIFSRVLFAWIALGSAFGPLVFARLARIPVSDRSATASVALGFLSAVALYLAPDTPGDIAERLLPFSIATLCLIIGSRRRLTS